MAAAPPSLSSSELSVEFAFRSLAENGLLLQVFSENMARYVSLSLSAGRVVLELSAFDFISIETASSFNTGLWYTVSANITQTDATLVVNGTETVTAPLPSLVQQFNTSAELFVGGLTPAVEELVMRWADHCSFFFFTSISFLPRLSQWSALTGWLSP